MPPRAGQPRCTGRARAPGGSVARMSVIGGFWPVSGGQRPIDLVLEPHPQAPEARLKLLAGRLHPSLDPVNLTVPVMILIEKALEVWIGGFQLVQPVS